MRRLLTSIDLSQHIEEFRQAVRRSLNPPRRQPYMTIRRHSSYGGNFGTHHQWALYCTTCNIPGIEQPIIVAQMPTWELALTAAGRHARLHHGHADT